MICFDSPLGATLCLRSFPSRRLAPSIRGTKPLAFVRIPNTDTEQALQFNRSHPRRRSAVLDSNTEFADEILFVISPSLGAPPILKKPDGPDKNKVHVPP